MGKNKTEREDLVKKYFLRTPSKPNYFWNFLWITISIILIIIGVMMLQASNGRNSDQFLIIVVAGLVFFIISFFSFLAKRNRYRRAYNMTEPKATDEQMDHWLDEGREMILKTAMKRLDVEDDDISNIPLVIDGPDEKTSVRPGKDKILRFRIHDMLLFFLTEHNVSTFQCFYDLGSNEILEDGTKEFPYKDITSLETETVKSDDPFYKFEKRKKIDELKSLSLYTSGGNCISIYYFDPEVSHNTEDYRLPPSDAEKTIKAIRKRLKEYKDKFSSGLQRPI